LKKFNLFSAIFCFSLETYILVVLRSPMNWLHALVIELGFLNLAIAFTGRHKEDSCGNSDFRVLQIDHINGGGTNQRKTMRQTDFYQRLIFMEEIELRRNYQLLCANCNTIKRYETKESATTFRTLGDVERKPVSEVKRKQKQ
jgi:hypothetical protein